MESARVLGDVVEWLFSNDVLAQPAVEERARLLFLDTLGCMVAGLDKPEPKRLAMILSELEPGLVRLPGADVPLSPTAAALVAGAAAAWDEACEGLARAHGRPGLHTFPVALALSLAENRGFGEALSALVTGFEIAGRLGEYLRIREGMHVDGTWGTFGAVAAAARLWRMSPAEARSAIDGAACHLPFSLYLPIPVGATVRNLYAGGAAVRGMLQAAAARAGFSAPAGAIETFDRLALGGDPDSKYLTPPGEWLILQGYLKAFAGVRHVHYGAAAAQAFRGEQPDIDAIETLDLATYEEAIRYCGNRAPKTPIEAQFSLSYGLAWTLVHGDLGPDAYALDRLADPLVRGLEARVTLSEDAALGRAGRRGARLSARGPWGERHVTVDRLPGDDEEPLSPAEISAKFRRYAAPVIGSSRAADIARAVQGAPLSRPLAAVLPGGRIAGSARPHAN